MWVRGKQYFDKITERTCMPIEHALSLQYLICENRRLLKKYTFVCMFYKFKNVFDSVQCNCNLLWYKLQLYRLNGALLNNITALLCKHVEFKEDTNFPRLAHRNVMSICVHI